MMQGNKHVRILLTVIFAAISLLVPGFGDLYRAEAKTAEITGATVNIRSGPATKYQKVGSASRGARFEVLGEKNGWLKIRFAAKSTGWVTGNHASVIRGSISKTTQPAAGQATTGPGRQAAKTAKAKKAGINIRKGPGTNYPAVARTGSGQLFIVIKELGGWYNIALGSGKTGWIHGMLVTVTGNVPVVKAPNDQKGGTSGIGGVQAGGKYITVRETVVNVRSSYSTSSSVVTKVKLGAKYPVLKQNGEWYLVSLPGNKQGWIAGWVAEVSDSSPASRDENTSDLPEGGEIPSSPSGESGSQTGNSGGTNPPVGNGTVTNGKGDEASPDGSGTTQDGGSASQDSSGTIHNGDDADTSVRKLAGIEFSAGGSGEEVLIIRSEGKINYGISRVRDPERLVLDFRYCDVNQLSDIAADGNLVSKIRIAQFSLTPMAVRVVLDLNKPVSCVPFISEDGKTLTLTMSEPSIRGKKIVVDAGHGGYDPGAIGVTGLQEKSFNLETALLLRDKLTSLGATVIMTREDDSFISLSRRATVANNAYADVFVSIHANASESAALNGTSTYYYAPFSKPLLYAQLGQRKGLAERIQKSLADQLGTRNMGIMQGNFLVLRDTTMPSVLIESAFLSNRSDEGLLKQSSFREKVAQAAAEGLVDYFAAGN